MNDTTMTWEPSSTDVPRRRRIDRLAIVVFVAFSLVGLSLFRIALGWHVTDPYVTGTVLGAVPPTAWISLVPAFVGLGALAALVLYRATGVPIPGSHYRQ